MDFIKIYCIYLVFSIVKGRTSGYGISDTCRLLNFVPGLSNEKALNRISIRVLWDQWSMI